MSIILANKAISQTPGNLANLIKKEKNIQKISYCGKLDPMSRGLMLFLTDSFCKKQDMFLKFDKIYQYQILFGFDTDSYDILGKINKMEIYNNVPKIALLNYINKLVGIHEQSFPPYSSICVKNNENLRKPLWWWSKENRISEIKIPSKEIEIYSTKFLGSEWLYFDQIIEVVRNRIKNLRGDFRQNEIMEIWENKYRNNGKKRFLTLNIEMHVSSGTYIRSIIQEIAKEFNLCAIAFDINRTKIGNYKL